MTNVPATTVHVELAGSTNYPIRRVAPMRSRWVARATSSGINVGEHCRPLSRVVHVDAEL